MSLTWNDLMNVTCYRCHQPGHVRRNCPKEQKLPGQSPGYAGTGENGEDGPYLPPLRSQAGDYQAWGSYAHSLLSQRMTGEACPVPGARMADYAEWGEGQQGPQACLTDSPFRRQQGLAPRHEHELREIAARQVAESRAARAIL